MHKMILNGGLLLISMAFAQTESIAQSKLRTADSLLTALHRDQGFDGCVLIADKGRIVYEKSFGYANEETKAPLTAHSLFNLNSITKDFTAVATMKLVEQGKLRLTDELQQYFPDLSYDPITINQLLTHTSGLEDYMANSVRQVLPPHSGNAAIEKAYAGVHPKLRFPPGSNWSYSNTNFLLLALIIEKVSGMSYPEFLARTIFRPARMSHSFVLTKNAPASLRNQIADKYDYSDFLAIRPTNMDSTPMGKMHDSLCGDSYGDGDVFCATGDLFKFHQALQTGKILNPGTLTLMYTPVSLPNGKVYQAGNANPDFHSGYGLGWLVAKDSSIGEIVWHSGSNPGTLTFFMRNITRDQCVIILNNNWYRGTFHLGGSLMNLLNDRPLQLMAPSLARKIGQEYTLHGSGAALALLSTLKSGKDYHIGFLEMNQLGYDLLGRSDTRTAIEVFKVNTEVYPASGDVWDSLAEAYYKSGNKEEAIKDYEKSIALDPKNENGKNMLKKIREEVK